MELKNELVRRSCGISMYWYRIISSCTRDFICRSVFDYTRVLCVGVAAAAAVRAPALAHTRAQKYTIGTANTRAGAGAPGMEASEALTM
eukprot:COSAG02_NODE_675_length_18611_cov_7.033492_3_plen_89_part_00